MPKILDDDEIEEYTSHTEVIKEDEVPPELVGIEDSGNNTKEQDNEHLNRVRSGDGLLSPRSIGMTIRPCVDATDWSIKVQYEWGTYKQEEIDDERRESRGNEPITFMSWRYVLISLLKPLSSRTSAKKTKMYVSTSALKK